MIIIYLMLLYLARNYDKPIIRFLCSIIPIILFGFVLIHFINFTWIKNETFNTFNLIVKILLGLEYLIILYYYFKTKKDVIKNIYNNYTFNELRKKNNNKFQEVVNKKVEDYLEKHNIDCNSDYFKVIENNIDNKSTEILEEYVWLEYLRFYKNQKYNKRERNKFFNFAFLLIHVIILAIILIVR